MRELLLKRVRKHIQTTQTNTKFKHMNASAKPDKQENVEKMINKMIRNQLLSIRL